MDIISLFSSIALIVFQVNRKSCVQNAFHSSASRAFVTRKRFSACWGNSPIPIERCLRHRAAHPFRMLQRQFLPEFQKTCFASFPHCRDIRQGTEQARTLAHCSRKSRSESAPRLQKIFTCACGLHAFCSPHLYAFSSLRSAGHCTGQS